MTHMRRIPAWLVACVAGAAFAQTAPRLERLPDVPPPPPGVTDLSADDPRVLIRPQEGDKVEEYREGGRVVMLRVTPRNGPPYYLVDHTGSGNWMRRESLDDGVRVPMWTIKTFD
jgi:hypothetical protein